MIPNHIHRLLKNAHSDQRRLVKAQETEKRLEASLSLIKDLDIIRQALQVSLPENRKLEWTHWDTQSGISHHLRALKKFRRRLRQDGDAEYQKVDLITLRQRIDALFDSWQVDPSFSNESTSNEV